jgi:hypothetical protein
VGWFFDDILRFADYIPVVLSHTIHRNVIRHHIHQEIKTHHGSIHTSETFMHGFRFWQHEDISTHISLLPCSSFFFFSFEFLFIFFAPLALDDKYIFIFPFSFDVFPSFDLNILDKRRRRKTIFFIPIIYARTHTRYVCFMKYFLEKATLVSHVLSSSFEIYKTCFSSFGSPIWTKKKF